MTYDPDRDQRAPADMNPNLRPHERGPGGTKFGIGLLLGLFAIAVFGAFLYFGFSGGERVAENPPVPPASTGAASPAEEPIRPTPSMPAPPPKE